MELEVFLWVDQCKNIECVPEEFLVWEEALGVSH